MQKYQDHVTDQYGNSQRGAVVLIKTAAGATATIYSDNGVTTKTNPITTGADGGVEFYAANGDYVLYVNGISTTKFTLLDVTEASTATPTSSDTVVGVQGGVVKRFAVPDIGIPGFSGADTTGVADSTTAIQSALTAYKTVAQLTGTFKITNELTLQDGQCIILGSGVTIRQYTADKNIFKAVQKDNVWIHCNGAVLYGQGGYSSAWTSTIGHEDRAIQFLGCTNSGIVKPRIKNCAAAGIAIIGGDGIMIDSPLIEGTHAYGVPLSSGDNHQSGIYLSDSATYGSVNNVRIVTPDISGTAQGILEEAQIIGIGHRTGSLTIVNPTLHDIPGQHGMYMMMGNLTVSSPVCTNVALSGIKLVSGEANYDTRNYVVTGLSYENGAGSGFEVAVQGTGSISDVFLSGSIKSAGYGLSITGKASRVKADIVVDTSGSHVYMTGATQSDIDITVNGKSAAQDGVLIVSTAANGIKLRPTLRESNTSATAGQAGIRIASASANVEIFDPDVTDASSKMVYGLFNSVAGSVVKVRGSAKFTGASDTAVRATGVITEWPTETTLSGTNGEFTSMTEISSSQPIVSHVQSTSATNVIAWGQTLDDESAYFIEAVIVGKLSGSAQRACYKATRLAYRDGAGSVLEGAEDVDVSIASAGFAGVYNWLADTNQIYVRVNSGGAATYGWTVTVTCRKVA